MESDTRKLLINSCNSTIFYIKFLGENPSTSENVSSICKQIPEAYGYGHPFALDYPNSHESDINDGEGDDELKFPTYIQATATVFCAGILAFGSLGNLLVPIVVCRTKELRNSTNLFLINLSIADLLVLVVCMPTVLIELHSRPEVWLLGEVMCKVVPFVEMMVAHASVLTILAITMERYYAICQPLKAGYICTKLRALLLIVAIWVVAILVTCPVIVIAEYSYTQYIDGNEVPVCATSAQNTWQRVYFYLVTIFLFVLPLIILAVLYGVITRHLMLDRCMLKSSTEKNQLKTRRQVVLMLAAVVVCFFVCLMPFRIFVIWIIVVPDKTIQSLGVEAYYNLLYFCRVMLYINSATNPILYNLISSKFRSAFARLLCCHTRLKRKSTLRTTQTSISYTGPGSGGDSLKYVSPSCRKKKLYYHSTKDNKKNHTTSESYV